MRMLVTVEFADAGAKSGQHRVLIIGRNGSAVAHGDIGLSLDDAQTLLGAIQDEFVEAQAAEIVELARTCSRCGAGLASRTGSCVGFTPSSAASCCRGGVPGRHLRIHN